MAAAGQPVDGSGAGAAVIDSAPADDSPQVRTASATGWLDGAATPGQGWASSLTDSTGAGAGTDSSGVDAGPATASGLAAASSGSSPSTHAGDQWLVDGPGDDEDGDWASLGEVLAPEKGSRSTIDGMATLFDRTGRQSG